MEKTLEKAKIIIKIIHHAGNYKIGATHIQKYVFLFQKLFSGQTNYHYKLHNYGPYSSELANDVNLLEMTGFIKKAYAPDGYGVFYSVNENASIARKLYEQKDESDEKLSHLLEKIPITIPAKKIGLIATLKYVYDILQEQGNYDEESLFIIVHSIKPDYEIQQIRGVWDHYKDILETQHQTNNY